MPDLSMKQRLWTLMLVASGLAAIQQTFFLPDERLLQRYIDYSPFLAAIGIAVLICCAGLHLVRTTDRTRVVDALVAFAITIFLAWLIPGRALIEADASHMVATSQGILSTGTALAPSAGVYNLQGELLVTQWNLDKRGVMFPLGLAALHSLFGFDADHALTLNLMCGFGVLLLIARIARRFLPPVAVISAPMFAASIPLLSIHMRSGTFDIANLCFLLLMLHGALSFFSKPTRNNFWILVASAGVVSQLRYESIAVACVMVLAALASIAFRERFADLRHPVIWTSPWLFVGAGLRRAFPYANDLPTGLESAWSFENFSVNFQALVQYLSRTDGITTSGNLVTFALAALGVVLLAARAKRFGPLNLVTTAIFFVTTIQLFFFWSNPLLAQTSRYFLPLMAVLSIFSALALSDVLHRARLRLIVLLIPFLTLVFSIRSAIEAREFLSLTYSANTSALAKRFSGTNVQCGTVFFTQSALPLLVRGFSVMRLQNREALDAASLSRIVGYEVTLMELPDLYVTPLDKLPLMSLNGVAAKCVRDPGRIEFIGARPQ